MNQARIHDWIRYVQENAQSVEVPDGETSKVETSDVSRKGAKKKAKAQNIAPPMLQAKPRQTRVRQKPETRAELIDRLTNPVISLHEASILLNVCSATVRRYAESGLLPHERTRGGQRRFRLRAVLALSRQLGGKRVKGLPKSTP